MSSPIEVVKQYQAKVSISTQLKDIELSVLFNPKEALIDAFQLGEKRATLYLSIVKYALDKGFDRSGKKSIYEHLASRFELEGWPQQDNGKFYSVDPCKELMGKNWPPVLFVQAFKQWISTRFIKGTWTEQPPVEVVPPTKLVAQEDISAIQQMVNSQTAANDTMLANDIQNNTELDNLDNDLLESSPDVVSFDSLVPVTVLPQTVEENRAMIKARQRDAALALVKVEELNANQSMKLTQEVLSALVSASTGISERAKELALDLLSELSLEIL